jgi:hypothetical protein
MKQQKEIFSLCAASAIWMLVLLSFGDETDGKKNQFEQCNLLEILG